MTSSPERRSERRKNNTKNNVFEKRWYDGVVVLFLLWDNGITPILCREKNNWIDLFVYIGINRSWDYL